MGSREFLVLGGRAVVVFAKVGQFRDRQFSDGGVSRSCRRARSSTRQRRGFKRARTLGKHQVLGTTPAE